MKYSRSTQRELKKLPCVAIPASTFLTTAGPAPGTLWFDRSNPSEPISPVSEVLASENNGQKWVHFEDGPPVYLQNFFDRVESGRYMLIGVKTQPSYHVVTP